MSALSYFVYFFIKFAYVGYFNRFGSGSTLGLKEYESMALSILSSFSYLSLSYSSFISYFTSFFYASISYRASTLTLLRRTYSWNSRFYSNYIFSSYFFSSFSRYVRSASYCFYNKTKWNQSYKRWINIRVTAFNFYSLTWAW